MKYNIHNIWKGNAPPKGRGNPYFIVISKEGRLRDLLQQSSTVTDSSPDKSEFEMTSTLGQSLLNMRDGPRGRAPANSLAVANGLVTLNQSSVSLCVYSVLSAVKNRNTTERALHTRHNRVIYALHPTKAFRDYCIPKRLELAGGKL